jgi:hypothetical protein
MIPSLVWTLPWAAGLFEGEGSIDYTHRDYRGRKRYRYARLQLSMTDEDVVRGFHAVIGHGRVNGPYGQLRGQPYWRWAAHGREAAEVLTLLLPFFGERRHAKANEVLAG